MSRKSWQAALKTTLKRLAKPGQPVRIAVVGIGNELCGDDAAGLRLAGILHAQTNQHGRLLVLEAGPAPENACGTLRRFKPDLVLLVDAAHMGAEPGEVRWLKWQDTIGFSASTHTLPLHLLAAYLTSEIGCEVALLGIQPAQTTVDTPLSPLVQEATESTASALSIAFQVI